MHEQGKQLLQQTARTANAAVKLKCFDWRHGSRWRPDDLN